MKRSIVNLSAVYFEDKARLSHYITLSGPSHQNTQSSLIIMASCNDLRAEQKAPDPI